MIIMETTLSKLVAELEQNAEVSNKELSQLKATFLVNFGPTAKKLPVVLDGKERHATEMFVKIMDHPLYFCAPEMLEALKGIELGEIVGGDQYRMIQELIIKAGGTK